MDTNYTKKSICRYFLRGCCRFGPTCRYQHDVPICWFYQRGKCRFGQRCRYRHILGPKLDPAPQMKNETNVNQEAGARLPNIPSDDTGVTCSICMENICEKRLPKHKKFGILPNCSHIFCEPCILTWRRMDGYSPDVVKGCPVCRVRSDFYLPSASMVEGGEKEGLILRAKQRCRKEFCSFAAESGLCPFEEECRYLSARRQEHREESQEEDDDDSADEDFVFFTSIVQMGEENICQFLDEARNNPATLREFMMRFLE